jgi:hypothetical protein
MEHLRVAFSPPRIEGSGTDCIGPFVLEGAIDSSGGVALRKTYVGKHNVAYDGHYDGEGRLWGMWRCGPDSGRWMISLRGTEEEELPEGILEIGPKRGR